MKQKKILIAFGTRPEAVKFAPLIQKLRQTSGFKCFVCLTGQHREMLAQVIRFFKIDVDTDLKLMRANQSLEYVSGRVIIKFGKIIRTVKPDLLFVQGDTATALMVAISSFYSRVPIAHLEAGLRTWDKYRPFPEEINRKLITHLADYHFSPSPIATRNLIHEGVSKLRIYEVGNTVVDAVQLARPLVKKKYTVFKSVNFKNRILFITAHRRESFGQGLREIFNGLKEIVQRHKDIDLVYPVHLNPKVSTLARKILGRVKRVHLMRPLTYEETCWIMNRCYLILTDSGGIQEEAPSFKKPVLVLRDVTERPEGIKAGVAQLVGTNQHKIVSAANQLLNSETAYKRMIAKTNPYGDGKASERIITSLRKILR